MAIMIMHGNQTRSMTNLLTADEAAAILGTNARQLAQWRYRGEGPPFVKVSHKTIRYRESDVNEWIASRVRTQTGAPA